MITSFTLPYNNQASITLPMTIYSHIPCHNLTSLPSLPPSLPPSPCHFQPHLASPCQKEHSIPCRGTRSTIDKVAEWLSIVEGELSWA